jgi:putative hemolysin
MHPSLIAAGAIVAAIVSLMVSTISYALRDYSRSRLQHQLERFGRAGRFETLIQQTNDLIFATASARLFANIAVLVCMLRLLALSHRPLGEQYLEAVLITGFITLLMSVAIPNAAAKYAGETFIAAAVPVLDTMRLALLPVTLCMHYIDDIIRRAAGATQETQHEEIEEEILAAVEEGEAEGVVGEDEREMIESVIELRDTTAGQIMTARSEIVAIELPATLDEVKRVIEESAHSRIPVYEGSLDHVVGILYARDLLRYVAAPLPQSFDLRLVLRAAFFVAESTPVRDLLADFRHKKVHMAVVLDEYGGTAGLVTIEDVIEELVGDITDEHEPIEPAPLRKVGERTWEADAKVRVDEVNAAVGLSLPEDAGFETLGGFVSTTLGSIPSTGTRFDHDGVSYTVLDAEPQRVNKVRMELLDATLPRL